MPPLESSNNTNGSILQSAGISVARCLHEIGANENLPSEYRRSLFNLWWNKYFELFGQGAHAYSEYGRFLLACMLGRGSVGIRKPNTKVLGRLVSALMYVDHIKDWVDDNAYRDCREQMGIVIRSRFDGSTIDSVVETLGSEFRLVGSSLEVMYRGSSWVQLVDFSDD